MSKMPVEKEKEKEKGEGEAKGLSMAIFQKETVPSFAPPGAVVDKLALILSTLLKKLAQDGEEKSTGSKAVIDEIKSIIHIITKMEKRYKKEHNELGLDEYLNVESIFNQLKVGGVAILSVMATPDLEEVHKLLLAAGANYDELFIYYCKSVPLLEQYLGQERQVAINKSNEEASKIFGYKVSAPPLINHLREKHDSIVKYLIEQQDADPNPDGFNFLLNCRSVGILKWYLERYPEVDVDKSVINPFSIKEEKSIPPLIYHVRTDHYDIVEYLLDYGANLEVVDPLAGDIALGWAVYGSNLPMAMLLLSRMSYDPDKINVKNKLPTTQTLLQCTFDSHPLSDPDKEKEKYEQQVLIRGQIARELLSRGASLCGVSDDIIKKYELQLFLKGEFMYFVRAVQSIVWKKGNVSFKHGWLPTTLADLVREITMALGRDELPFYDLYYFIQRSAGARARLTSASRDPRAQMLYRLLADDPSRLLHKKGVDKFKAWADTNKNITGRELPEIKAYYNDNQELPIMLKRKREKPSGLRFVGSTTVPESKAAARERDDDNREELSLHGPLT